MSRSPINLKLSFLAASLTVAYSAVVAQEAEPLSEAFLLYLAEGMEVDGEWHDPMELAGITELQELPSDELAWVAEQEISELESMSEEIISGEEDE